MTKRTAILASLLLCAFALNAADLPPMPPGMEPARKVAPKHTQRAALTFQRTAVAALPSSPVSVTLLWEVMPATATNGPTLVTGLEQSDGSLSAWYPVAEFTVPQPYSAPITFSATATTLGHSHWRAYTR